MSGKSFRVQLIDGLTVMARLCRMGKLCCTSITDRSSSKSSIFVQGELERSEVGLGLRRLEGKIGVMAARGVPNGV